MARWVPVYADEKKQLCCMSIGFMLENKDDSVVWRGPKKTGTDYRLFFFFFLQSVSSVDADKSLVLAE